MFLYVYDLQAQSLVQEVCRQLHQKVEEAINPKTIIHFSAIFEDNFGVMGKVDSSKELSQ